MEHSLGTKFCPAEYDRLIVRVVGSQNWDTNPTVGSMFVYYQIGEAEPVLFLLEHTSFTDICATDAVFRMICRSVNLFIHKKIAVPKEIVYELHNPYAYCILTRQTNRMMAYQFRKIMYIARLKKAIDRKAKIIIELVDLNYQFNRDNEDYQWRRSNHNQTVPSEVETGKKFRELYKKQLSIRKEIINGIIKK